MGEITAGALSSMRPAVARERVRVFGEQFGMAHLFFAQHAAFPLALTSDLLYRLWANFQRTIRDEKLSIPWIAVADLLLSPLCEEVGYELYEMDIAIRTELLTALKTNPAFGPRRINELSHFLLEYVRQQLHSSSPAIRQFAQAQRWTALAYTQPGQATRELAEALKALDQYNRVEQIRVVSLMETLEKLAEPLAALEGFTPLLTYARSVERLARGDMEGAKAQLDALQQVKLVEQATGVHLPVFENMEGKGKEYEQGTQNVQQDFFISYHSADTAWAQWIAWQLEEAGYTIVLQSWNFRPGANFVEEMETVAHVARRLIVILSPDYLETLATLPEWIDAFFAYPRNGPDFMVAFQVRECRDMLNRMLGVITYTDLIDKDETTARSALLERVSEASDTTAVRRRFPPGFHSVVSEQPRFPDTSQPASMPRKAVEIFLSYTRKDEDFRKELEMNLALLKRQRQISVWHDRLLSASAEWASEIDAHLNTASVILLLISADFLASDYCYGIEMQRALERHELGEALVIPIILRPCPWENSPLGRLQVLPKSGRAISTWVRRSEAFYAVARDIQQAIEEFTNRPTLSVLDTPKKTMEQWKEEGDKHFAAHRYEEALEAYSQAIALDPQTAHAYVDRGRLYSEMRQYEQALADYNRAIELKPDYAGAYSDRGFAYFQLQQYERALADYDRAIELESDYPSDYIHRGLLYVRLEKYQQAIEDYERAISLDPVDTTAYIMKGEACSYLRRFHEALASYERAIYLDSNNSSAYVGKGNMLTALQRYEEAVVSYNRAIKLKPDFAEAYIDRGRTYSVLKDYENAIASYQIALQTCTQKTSPMEWAYIQASLGDVYSIRTRGKRQENLETAISYYQAALQVYTREIFPEQWSELQQKLGDAFAAFSELPNVDEQATLDRALTYYEQVSPFESYVDASELAVENVFQEHLFARLAQEIAAFSPKLRAALLSDLANRMSFDEQPTPLQQAFLNVGIRLQDYRQPPPTDPGERGRQAALRSLAYKRLRGLIKG